MKEHLDRIIHQPIRTKMMAYLMNIESCDYTTMKKMLDISDGNMTTHIKELVASNYISVEKAFVNNKPKTTYHITQHGRDAFQCYIQALRTFIMSV